MLGGRGGSFGHPKPLVAGDLGDSARQLGCRWSNEASTGLEDADSLVDVRAIGVNRIERDAAAGRVGERNAGANHELRNPISTRSRGHGVQRDQVRRDDAAQQEEARDAEPNALTARIDRLLEVLDQGIDLKRRVIEELRPTLLDNMGLTAAIRWQVDEVCGRAQLRCACHFPAQEPDVHETRPHAKAGEELHFGRAAAGVHIVQSALSRRLDVPTSQLGFQHAEPGSKLSLAEIAAGQPVAEGVDRRRSVGAEVGHDGERRRLIRIGEIDLQPCGGTHVRNTSEIGPLKLGKIEKKGAINRRVAIHFA